MNFKHHCLLFERFKSELHNTTVPMKVLELGTKRSDPSRTTSFRGEFPKLQWIRSDLQTGLDVDVACDIHNISQVFPEPYFDVIIACSVLEHIEQPWVALAQLHKILRPGGSMYIQTHFSFPEHGYPNDYFRFTKEGLRSLLVAAGFTSVITSYSFECTISSHDSDSTRKRQSYLNSNAIVRKMTETETHCPHTDPVASDTGVLMQEVARAIPKMPEHTKWEERVHSLEASTSWKITQPMRDVVHAWKALQLKWLPAIQDVLIHVEDRRL